MADSVQDPAQSESAQAEAEVQPTLPGPTPMSVISLALGVLSLAMSCGAVGIVPGIPAMVIGKIASKRIEADPMLAGRDAAKAGFRLGLIGTVLTLVYWVVIAASISLRR